MCERERERERERARIGCVCVRERERERERESCDSIVLVVLFTCIVRTGRSLVDFVGPFAPFAERAMRVKLVKAASDGCHSHL